MAGLICRQTPAAARPTQSPRSPPATGFSVYKNTILATVCPLCRSPICTKISRNPVAPRFDDDEDEDEKIKHTPAPVGAMIQKKFLEQRKIFLWGAVTDESAKELTEKLLYLETIGPGKDITFYINSPGGSITAGMAVYDTIKLISSPVAIVVTGMAASMGSILLSAGTKGRRYLYPHARVLIHQPLISGRMVGPASDINIQAKEMEKLRRELNTILANASGQPFEKVNRDFRPRLLPERRRSHRLRPRRQDRRENLSPRADPRRASAPERRTSQARLNVPPFLCPDPKVEQPGSRLIRAHACYFFAASFAVGVGAGGGGGGGFSSLSSRANSSERFMSAAASATARASFSNNFFASIDGGGTSTSIV